MQAVNHRVSRLASTPMTSCSFASARLRNSTRCRARLSPASFLKISRQNFLSASACGCVSPRHQRQRDHYTYVLGETPIRFYQRIVEALLGREIWVAQRCRQGVDRFGRLQQQLLSLRLAVVAGPKVSLSPRSSPHNTHAFEYSASCLIAWSASSSAFCASCPSPGSK